MHDKWRRREVLAGLGAGLVLGRCGWPAIGQPIAEKDAGPYIDVHTHIGQTWNGDEPLTPSGLLRFMDQHHVAKAVILPLVSPESSSRLNLTEAALSAAHAHPDRLIAFCAIDPRTSYRGGRTGLRAMLKEYADAGAKGFGELKAGVPIDDRRMFTVYEACEDLKLPVLFHLDLERCTDKPGLPGLALVLKRHPSVQFIGHGPGFWASISGEIAEKDLGGYPTGKVKTPGTLDRLMDEHKNLWCDLSAGSGAGAIARDREFGRDFLIRRSERVLFGTDYLKPGQDVPQFKLLASLDLPARIRARIERENAAKLLGIAL